MSQPDASREPIHATIAGVAVVTIPLDDYAALLDCRRLVAENNLRRSVGSSAASRIERDPEVAAFLVESMPGRTITEVYALCRSRFGDERTPSRSSVQRFRDRVRTGP